LREVTLVFQGEARDDPGQFAWSDRLFNVILEPCAQDAGSVFGAGESGEGGSACCAAALGR